MCYTRACQSIYDIQDLEADTIAVDLSETESTLKEIALEATDLSKKEWEEKIAYKKLSQILACDIIYLRSNPSNKGELKTFYNEHYHLFSRDVSYDCLDAIEEYERARRELLELNESLRKELIKHESDLMSEFNIGPN
ncbi:hypothetical protein ACOZ35_06715 [Halorubrum xinjiangense]|uniref:hypothetical protein n=1 Tax=Halorubrum xinjiangense TaxID=261291 RepID=UPI003C6FB0AE